MVRLLGTPKPVNKKQKTIFLTRIFFSATDNKDEDEEVLSLSYGTRHF